jgi:hypothetical protein
VKKGMHKESLLTALVSQKQDEGQTTYEMALGVSKNVKRSLFVALCAYEKLFPHYF